MLLVYFFLFGLITIPCSADAPSGPYIWYDSVRGRPYNVSYDSRSFLIDGQRTLLLGGDIHYPRFAPYQWRDTLQKLKDDGMNHVQMYVFWNFHEHDHDISSGIHNYDFTGRADIVKFLATAAEVGLFVNLRIGPYVCAEWNYGGIPLWIRDIPGIKFRDYNQPWMTQMATFVRAIAMVAYPFLAKNGGPIILAQIENEYQGSQEYVDWAGALADSLNFKIPWVMCNGMSAKNMINTYNFNDGARDYAEMHEQAWPDQPLAWTENEGWFQEWDRESYASGDDRTPQDMANVIAKWFAIGGAHHNYYMYFGGNHIGLWGAASLTNMYADGANYRADNLPNEPKRTHLNRLHQILISYNDALMSSPKQIHNAIKLDTNGAPMAMGTDCDGTKSTQQIDIADCDSGDKPCTIRYNGNLCLEGQSYAMPVQFKPCDPSSQFQQFKWLPDTKQLLNVGSNQCLDLETSQFQLDMWPCKSPSDAANQRWTYQNSSATHRLQSEIQNKCTTAVSPQVSAYAYGTGSRRIVFLVNTFNGNYTVTWEGKSYTIPQQSVSILDNQGTELYQTAKVNSTGIPTQRVNVPLLNSSNLKWEAYTESRTYDGMVSYPTPQEQLSITKDKTEYLVYTTQTEIDPSVTDYNITIESRAANALLVFVNGAYKGQTYDVRKTNDNATLSLYFQIPSPGTTNITITIVSVSLGLECLFNNQKGPEAQDKKGIIGTVKLNDKVLSGPWGHRAFLNGEKLQVYAPGSTDEVSWTEVPSAANIPPFTWFRTKFDRPSGMKSDDIIILQFGEGSGFTENSRGHFYLNGVDLGRYFGISVNSKKVQSNYFIPNDIIQDKDNLFVYVDEAGGTHPYLITFSSTHLEIPSSQ